MVWLSMVIANRDNDSGISRPLRHLLHLLNMALHDTYRCTSTITLAENHTEAPPTLYSVAAFGLLAAVMKRFYITRNFAEKFILYNINKNSKIMLMMDIIFLKERRSPQTSPHRKIVRLMALWFDSLMPHQV